MDTLRFESPNDRFPILDLVASFAFKSASSIAFDLGRYSDTIEFADDDIPLHVGPCRVFKVAGRVDVHHPCEGHIKTQIQVLVPSEYHEFERMQELVGQVFDALAIPRDETFEALFVSAAQQTAYENATDREGDSDRIYVTLNA